MLYIYKYVSGNTVPYAVFSYWNLKWKIAVEKEELFPYNIYDCMSDTSKNFMWKEKKTQN